MPRKKKRRKSPSDKGGRKESLAFVNIPVYSLQTLPRVPLHLERAAATAACPPPMSALRSALLSNPPYSGVGTYEERCQSKPSVAKYEV